MTPGNMPLNIYRGDTYHWRFTLWADANKTEPTDLTGVTVKSEIREKPSGTLITPMECTIELPNIIHLTLSADASGALPGKGAWDLQLTYDSGDVVTILAGDVVVTPDVTDSTRVASRKSSLLGAGAR